MTAEAVAEIEGWDTDGTCRLMSMLVSVGLLTCGADRYDLVPEAEWYLVAGKPGYMGNFLLHLIAWEGDRQLGETVRSGQRPILSNLVNQTLDDIWPEFFAYHRAAPEQQLGDADAMWESLDIHARDRLSVLDFACGSAIKTLALCRRHPGVRATLPFPSGSAFWSKQALRTWLEESH